MRSGTLDAPAVVGFAEAAPGRRARAGRDRPPGDCPARRADRAGPARRARGDPQRRPGRPSARATRTSPSSAVRAMPCSCCSTRAGVECSTGSACSAGIAQPSHVLLAMGADEARARGSLRFSLGHTSTEQRRRRPGRRARSPRSSARGARASPSRGADARPGRCVRRRRLGGGRRAAVDAGHDVTGVHLALSRNPQSFRSGARGCCTMEDARDARRAADVLGIPFYVWDLADRFAEDVVDDFVDEYAAGRTPNPCLRCNEKIKFAAVLDKALALGFDAVATGHYARLVDGPDGARAAPGGRPGKDQSYVLGVLTSDQLAAAMFPLGDSTKADVRDEAEAAASPSPQSRTATTSASSPTATRQACCARGWDPPLGTSSMRDGARARHARRHLRLHHRAAQGPACRARPRRTAGRATCWTSLR